MSTEALDHKIAAQRLGRPAEVAKTAARAYRGRTFFGRHPLLSFVVLPIVTLPLFWGASIAGFVLVATYSKYIGGGPGEPDFARVAPVLPILVAVMVLVPICLAATLFCWLAKKAECHWKWPLIACTLLALLSGPAMIDVAIRGPYTRGMLHGTKYSTAPGAEHGRGFLSFGFGVSQHPTLAQLAQFALPLTIGAWAVSRQVSQRRNACLS